MSKPTPQDLQALEDAGDFEALVDAAQEASAFTEARFVLGLFRA